MDAELDELLALCREMNDEQKQQLVEAGKALLEKQFLQDDPPD